MSIQIEGINYLKFVLSQLGRLGFMEPDSVEIGRYGGEIFGVSLLWRGYRLPDYTDLQLNVWQTGFANLRQLDSITGNLISFWTFNTGDIRIVV